MNAVRRGCLLLLVAAGVASNLATTQELNEGCDGGYIITPSGSGQTGAATAPLGRPLTLRVQCRGRRTGNLVDAYGEPVSWQVASGGGLIDGVSSRTLPVGLWPTPADPISGLTGVLWQLGPTVGEQTVTARVADQTITFRASAGGPASGGTCTGGAGTDFDAERAVVGDERWVLAGSPYRGQRVRVHGGATLAIEPGVQTCLSELVVDINARLAAEGSAALPLRMSPRATPNATWRLLIGTTFSPGPAPGPHRLRHVAAANLVMLDNFAQPWAFEDSQLVFDGRLRSAQQCPMLRWTVGASSNAADAVRRVVIDGYGGADNGCGAPAVRLTADSLATAVALPFEARVLRAAGEGVRVGGSRGGVFALAGCEVSGSAGDGVVFERAATGSGAVVLGCNLVGNTGLAVRSEPPGSGAVLARGNWWGDAAGPPAAGPNAVGAGVDATLPLPQAVPLGY